MPTPTNFTHHKSPTTLTAGLHTESIASDKLAWLTYYAIPLKHMIEPHVHNKGLCSRLRTHTITTLPSHLLAPHPQAHTKWFYLTHADWSCGFLLPSHNPLFVITSVVIFLPVQLHLPHADTKHIIHGRWLTKWARTTSKYLQSGTIWAKLFHNEDSLMKMW